ncbi:MAG TPA: Co2+/Mg2+ efflux protein ApaG [Sphingobium sp.]|uniref:Co2+/Mg2+ efflux protein ApaG n=1 Tax=Sphingobium sp. TaxID=1912891 RepID=UPI002ED582F0
MLALFPYSETTKDVTVRVSVAFLAEQSEPERGRWFWAYHIRIENAQEHPVQLLARRWHITDGRGSVHTVEGEGVVGEQPVIQPGTAYDYVSGCPLATPTGVMVGSFQMLGSDGGLFDVQVPRFGLTAPAVSG